MKRSKYKPKNPGEYRAARKCHRQGCEAVGYVSYRHGIAGTRYSCPEHVHQGSAKPKVGTGVKVADIKALLSL